MIKIIMGCCAFLVINLQMQAQSLFTKEPGPALGADNSLGAILMDLSTQNKDVLLKGESAKSDTSKKYYPNRLLGASQVYISRTIEQESLNEGLQDASTMGQIYATFAVSGVTLDAALKSLSTNIEKSTVFGMFFKINTDNKDANRIEYVQNKPFTLPNNGSINAKDLEVYNKGLKQNFEEYEIRISVEKGSRMLMGQTMYYPQVRSWVQLKPILNLKFELPASFPTQPASDTLGVSKDLDKYFQEMLKYSKEYTQLKEDYPLSKKGLKPIIFNPLRTGYMLNEKSYLFASEAIKYYAKVPKALITTTMLETYFKTFAWFVTLHDVERKTIVDTFTK